jgi:hypothetical protein
MQAQVKRALRLLTSEKADEIIGEAPDEYGLLVRGIDGAHGMFWVMAISNGLNDTPQTRKMAGQSKLAMLTLIHYAYALGVRHGRGDSE